MQSNDQYLMIIIWFLFLNNFHQTTILCCRFHLSLQVLIFYPNPKYHHIQYIIIRFLRIEVQLFMVMMLNMHCNLPPIIIFILHFLQQPNFLDTLILFITSLYFMLLFLNWIWFYWLIQHRRHLQRDKFQNS